MAIRLTVIQLMAAINGNFVNGSRYQKAQMKTAKHVTVFMRQSLSIYTAMTSLNPSIAQQCFFDILLTYTYGIKGKVALCVVSHKEGSAIWSS